MHLVNYWKSHKKEGNKMWLDVFKNIAMHNKTFLTKLIFREKKGSKVRFLIQDIFTSGQSDCSASFLV